MFVAITFDGKMGDSGVKKSKQNNGGSLGFEQKLWQAADKLRSNMDAAEYKHVVFGLMFLKYISDAFEERRAMLEISPKTSLLSTMH